MTPVDGAGGLNGKIRWGPIASDAPTKKDARPRHLDEDIGPDGRGVLQVMTYSQDGRRLHGLQFEVPL
jgi:hypothetical protein